jgi:hypothetical protein
MKRGRKGEVEEPKKKEISFCNSATPKRKYLL